MNPKREPEPMRTNDLRMVQIGTVLWAIAFFALLPFRSSLEREGRGWWLATCACGVALGFAGLAVVRRRERRHAQRMVTSGYSSDTERAK